MYRADVRPWHCRPGRLLPVLILLLGVPAYGGTATATEVALDHQGLVLLGKLQIANESRPDTIILMVHGTLAHSGMEIMHAFQERLSDLGLNSLAITLSLDVDKRSGMFDCSASHRHRHEDALGEIGAWQRWLKGRGFSRVTLLGHSRGGNQAALYVQSARSQRPDALVLIAPMSVDPDDPENEPLGKLITEARARDQQPCNKDLMRIPAFLHCGESLVSPATFLSYYAPDYEADTPTILQGINLPVLLILGTEDPVSRLLAGRVPDRPGIEVFEIDGADHFFRDLYADEGAEAIADFLSVLSGVPGH